MTPAKVKVCIATFSYAGNGGYRSTEPEVCHWIRKVMMAAKSDPRVDVIGHAEFGDTPITMCRNRAIREAIDGGFDALVMIDSDMIPDCEPDGKPFWETSFDFFHQHYAKGPSVVCAPYCGPPPDECVYAFRWTDLESRHPNARGRLEMYPRDWACRMTGISEVGACPTGIILFDTRVFELTAPRPASDLQALADYKAGVIDEIQALKAIKQHSWCYYEYGDSFESKKSSTEDVTLTRDISLAGIRQLGYNPLYCNWDAWAGHVKPKIVRKPQIWKVEDVAYQMREALTKPVSYRNRMMEVGGAETNGVLQHG